MGSQSNESFAEFLESLKQAGVAITNEPELRERLAEAQRWRFAFMTLAANGRIIGIRFEDRGATQHPERISQTLAQFQFPEGSHAILEASLRAQH